MLLKRERITAGGTVPLVASRGGAELPHPETAVAITSQHASNATQRMSVTVHPAAGTIHRMDAFLAIASKRDVRDYASTPIALEVRDRILDSGRLSGSSRNTQKWEFVVVSGAAQERLADAVYAPENVRGATLVVAIVGEARGFDVGRCAQNMMLAAWAHGVASCPNGIRDSEAAAAVCGGEVAAVISFGYPAKPRRDRNAEAWSADANRKPLVELVREVS